MFSSLRKVGCSNVSYIDDSKHTCHSKSEYEDNVMQLVKIVDTLGFTVHTENSVSFPPQEIVFVNFCLTQFP